MSIAIRGLQQSNGSLVSEARTKIEREIDLTYFGYCGSKTYGFEQFCCGCSAA